MENLALLNSKFNDLPLFDGAKGFSVIYLDGEFHLFYAVNSFMKGCVLHFISSDGYLWEQKENVISTYKFVDSVTAYTQKGKIYLYFLTRNILGRTNAFLTVSKDGETFSELPNAIIKNSKLKDIKIFYSNGVRYLLGSEQKAGKLPLYCSSDGVSWQKAVLENVTEEGVLAEYVGAPSPFVAYDKTLIAYSVCGAKVSECQFNLNDGTLVLGEKLLETYAEVIRSVMVREGTPLLFLGCGCSLIPVEVYFEGDKIAFRLYREVLKKAKLRVDNGVEENSAMPLKLVRESGILHQFDLPLRSGVTLEMGGATLEIGEKGELILDGDVEVYPTQEDKVQVNILDEGNLIVVEVCGGAYPIPTAVNELISVSVGDYDYVSYKL